MRKHKHCFSIKILFLICFYKREVIRFGNILLIVLKLIIVEILVRNFNCARFNSRYIYVDVVWIQDKKTLLTISYAARTS